MALEIFLSEPSNTQEWHDYFELRWQILRLPWQQPRGSERDQLDSINNTAYIQHIMALNSQKEVVGVGRIHQENSSDARIRYMAVHNQYRRQGIASELLRCLESFAPQWHCSRIVLNARENIQSFYERNDYKLAGKGELLFNKVPHVRMYKLL